ncbi:amino acid ABC transporter ATP-binding protein [Labrys monachus]|uniref:Polar amino acid transport system ATP-binding protein n=1 Tax=Labrys monachus TaxID=217067 RepID=A0ABU0FIE6_9HYPH|nr:amino acid ABC transporter ATP-binding protein [Labrys monachus]MDQ0393888.1 polar amino acid transport system ATP-binding protein [Labrys monachus]
MPAPDAPILEIKALRKHYGTAEVLKGISLTVAPREVVAIVGASGSGKSTFLRCINLLETPSSGTLAFENLSFDFATPERQWRREASLRQLRTGIGMVFQSYNLWPHRTVLENVTEAPIRVKNVPRAEAIEQAHHLLGRIGLYDKRDAYPSRLSGGQQQRVAVARALAMKPRAMLFDEVTSALDPELVGEVLDLMAALAADGMTMLVVTHEIAFARDVSTRTIFVDGGLISEEGPSRQVLTNPDNERTRQFLRRVLHQPIAAAP